MDGSKTKTKMKPSASTNDGLLALDRRLLSLEIIVRGEDGKNGLKSELRKLCERFDAFEKKAIRVISICAALPGIVVSVILVLKFLEKL